MELQCPPRGLQCLEDYKAVAKDNRNDPKKPQPRSGFNAPSTTGTTKSDTEWDDEAEAAAWADAEAKAIAEGKEPPAREGFLDRVRHALHIGDTPSPAVQVPEEFVQVPGGPDVPTAAQGKATSHRVIPPDEPNPNAAPKSAEELREAHKVDLGADGAELQGLPINKVPGKLRKFVSQ